MNAMIQGAKVMQQNYNIIRKRSIVRGKQTIDLMQNFDVNCSAGSSHGKSDDFFFILWRCALVSQEKYGIPIIF